MNLHAARTKLLKTLNYSFAEYAQPTRERVRLEEEIKAAKAFLEVAKEYLE